MNEPQRSPSVDITSTDSVAGSSNALPGVEEAAEFLSRWYGTSPRQLVTIIPDGALAAKCLWPQETAQEREWLQAAVAAGRNVYFSVNQPRWALDKRAEKKDISSVRALHVDIDPNRGESPEACKLRVLPMLAEFDPAPSVVVDSGGGVQAFWMLEQPITLDGTADTWIGAERYNIALQLALGGDSCHNVDRIMRVPGTINVPNKKKLAKGRVATQARIVHELTTWNRYPIDRFQQAPDAKQAGRTTSSGKVIIPDNLLRFASTDDLPVALDEYTKMLIVNGKDTENLTKYPSRSEVLWRVCCDMVRAGATDDIIACILLDPDFKISSSVLDKPRPEMYAAEQISAARDEAIDPALRELNAKHAVIEIDRSGRCTVLSEEIDSHRRELIFQTFEHFTKRYGNRKIQIGTTGNGIPKFKALGQWWLEHPDRRQFRKVVFEPDLKTADDCYNLWRGFGCKEVPGENHVPILTFIREVICAGNEAYYEYFIHWLPRMIQYPSKIGQVAIVLRGKKGAGKSFLARAIGSIIGQHFIHVSSTSNLVGKFNAHLRDCLFLFADEAFFAGDKQHEGVLKALITEPAIMIERKGVDAESWPNRLHLMMASNEQWVVPATADERRFLVLDVENNRVGDHAYFESLQNQLDRGGRENLLHFFRNLDLSNFEVRAVPMTNALEEQKAESLSPAAAYLLLLLEEGILPNNINGRPHIASSKDQQGRNGQGDAMGLETDARRREPKMRDYGIRALATAMKKIGCRPYTNGSYRGWEMPDLPLARAAFDREFAQIRWNDTIASWAPAGAAHSRDRDPF